MQIFVFNVPKKRATNLNVLHFTRYKEGFVNNFQRSDSGYSRQSVIRSGRKDDMNDYFFNIKNSSIREAAQDLNHKKSSVHRIIRYDVKMHLYRSHKVHNISDTHKEQRKMFCEWLVKNLRNLSKE